MDAAGEVGYAGVAGFGEELGYALGADAGVAMDDDFAVAVDLGEAVGDFVLRDQFAANLGDLVLPGFAYVDQLDFNARVDALLKFIYGELGDSVLQ